MSSSLRRRPLNQSSSPHPLDPSKPSLRVGPWNTWSRPGGEGSSSSRARTRQLPRQGRSTPKQSRPSPEGEEARGGASPSSPLGMGRPLPPPRPSQQEPQPRPRAVRKTYPAAFPAAASATPISALGPSAKDRVASPLSPCIHAPRPRPSSRGRVPRSRPLFGSGPRLPLLQPRSRPFAGSSFRRASLPRAPDVPPARMPNARDGPRRLPLLLHGGPSRRGG